MMPLSRCNAGSTLYLSSVVLLSALFLQGCNISVPMHSIGNWEAKPNYLKEFEYTPPGQSGKSAVLNSCNDPSVTPALQCSGHGQCRDWSDKPDGGLAFCECDRYYADPECRTPRKSQLTAFLLSLFLGFFGADQLYLGFPWWAFAKLLLLAIALALMYSKILAALASRYFEQNLAWQAGAAIAGGLSVWYVYDVVRIGSTPVYTRSSFQLANDLPHFVFVLVVLTAAFLCAFAIALSSICKQRVSKAQEIMLLRAQAQPADDEQQLALEEPEPMKQPMPATAPLRSVNFVGTGYGSTLPRSVPTMPPIILPSMGPPITTPVATAAPGTLPPGTMQRMQGRFASS